VIEGWSGRRPVAGVFATLTAHGVPSSPIATFAEAASSDHARHRGLIAEIEQPAAGRVKVIEQPVHFSEAARGALRAAPGLGADTEAVLGSVGFSAEEIAALRAAGAV